MMIKWLGNLFLALALSTTAFYSVDGRPVTDLTTITTTLASVGATLLGFVLTAVTILSALTNKRMMSNMRKTGHSETLLQELFGCAILFLLTTAFGLSCLLAPANFGCAVSTLSVAYFGFGLLVLSSCGRKLFRIMTIMNGNGSSTKAGPSIA